MDLGFEVEITEVHRKLLDSLNTETLKLISKERLRGEIRVTYGTLCGAIEQIGATKVMALVQ